MTTPREPEWEQRMAARARERDQRRRDAEAAALQELLPEGDDWLNGWPRSDTTVRIGTAIHCIACGRIHGVVCTAFPPDWEPPGPEPVWPYSEADCPIPDCSNWAPFYSRGDIVTVLTLTADDWYQITGRGKVAYFSNRNHPDVPPPLTLVGETVNIDGDDYEVREVDQSCRDPHCTVLPHCGFALIVRPVSGQG